MRRPKQTRHDSRAPDRGDADAAALAVQVLGWLASEPERLSRFLAMTGLTPASIRGAAGEPHFLASVIEYLMQDEALLVAFAADADSAPTDIERARQALAGAAWERETP